MKGAIGEEIAFSGFTAAHLLPFYIRVTEQGESVVGTNKLFMNATIEDPMAIKYIVFSGYSPEFPSTFYFYCEIDFRYQLGNGGSQLNSYFVFLFVYI